jgi:hypothetical protein
LLAVAYVYLSGTGELLMQSMEIMKISAIFVILFFVAAAPAKNMNERNPTRHIPNLLSEFVLYHGKSDLYLFIM